MRKSTYDKIQKRLDKAVEEECCGVNFLAIQDKETYIESGNVAKDSIFRCYSMTKPITASAVMHLIEAGAVKLDNPVSMYIKSFKDITIKDLLNMTSGLGYDRDNPQIAEVYKDINNLSTIEFANRIGKCNLLFKPSTQWRYGVDADILGAIVEVVTETRYDKYLQDSIFSPLGMKDTHFVVPKEKRNRIVKVDTGNYLGIKDDGGKNKFHSGGAGLFTTIYDYSKFARSLIDCSLLSKETVKYMTTVKTKVAPYIGWSGLEGYGYGNLLKIAKDKYGWFGWMGTFWINEGDTTLLLMMNRRDGEYSRVPHDIYEILQENAEILKKPPI